MCGICGLFNLKSPLSELEHELKGMTSTLVHRGPDGTGMYANGSVGLGHTRLSIIDVDGGHQPLFNEDRSVVLVCNGEIYNYVELRQQLRRAGHEFKTGSDSEVIVHLWEEYGTECLEPLRGMFAFALYDQNKRTLFGARDRFGQKPCYYHWNGENFSFASEIKALLPLPQIQARLNPRALDQFLFYRYIPHPNTLFDGILQLPPAHFFRVDMNGLRIERYWCNRFPASPDERTDEEHLAHLEEALLDAVKSHLVSDVPVGIFLSGGIDSSLVTALARDLYSEPLKSFSISYPGHRYDESRYALMVSDIFGTEHYEFPYEPGDIEKNIRTLISFFDQPLADPAALPLSFLSEKASGHIKVVLTGDGGDELFAGYEKYQRARKVTGLLEWLDRKFPQLFSINQLSACVSDPFQFRRLRSRVALRMFPTKQCAYSKGAWEGWQRYRLYSDEFRKAVNEFESVDRNFPGREESISCLNLMLALDQNSYLPDDLLLKTDYSTMAHGLEARAPFLDHRLARSAATLPDHLLADVDQTKIALRRVAEQFLPPDIVARPKRGFSVPMKRWFRNELKGWVYDLLIETSTTVPKYFRKDTVKTILEEHAAGRENHTQKIFALIVFELWYRHYLS